MPKKTPKRMRRIIYEEAKEGPRIRKKLFGEALAVQERAISAAIQYPRKERRERLRAIKRDFHNLNRKVADFDRRFELFARGEGVKEYTEMLELQLAEPKNLMQIIFQESIPNLENFLMSLHWEISEAPLGSFFYTSDSPVIIMPLEHPSSPYDYEANFHFFAAALGIVDFTSMNYLSNNYPPIEFHVPLSPSYILHISHVDYSVDQKVISKETTDLINRHSIAQANKEIFSHTNDFSIFESGYAFYEILDFRYREAFTKNAGKPEQLIHFL